MGVLFLCRTTITMTGAFLDAFQKVADMATGTRGKHTDMHKEHIVYTQQETPVRGTGSPEGNLFQISTVFHIIYYGMVFFFASFCYLQACFGIIKRSTL